MKKHYITSIFLFLLMGQVVLAQNKKIEIRKKSYDFGNVDNWDSPPAHFTIKNNGTQPLTFLPTFQHLEVLVEFPKKPIPPNGSGEVRIYYYTGDKGAFSHKIPVYSNFDGKPFHLTIKGNILSIANSALMACPGSVPEPDNSVNAHKHNIVVIDKETMHAIENATVRILDSNGNEDKVTAKLNGMAIIQAPTGRYVIQAEHPGYHPNERLTMLTKDKKRIVIELERIQTERPKEEPKEVLTAKKTKRTPPSTRTNTSQNTRTNTTQTQSKYKPRTTKTEPSQKPVDYADVYAKRKEERAKAREKEQDRLTERAAAKARREQVKGEQRAVAEAKKREERAMANKAAQQQREKEQAQREREQAQREIEQAQRAAQETKETNEVVRTKETNAVVPPPNSSNTLSKSDYQANNIVFLIDVSQSMEDNDKLDLMKNAMKRLTNVLRDIDKITVIVYSTKSEVILPSISSDNKEAVYQAIQSLEAEGSTRGIKGLEMAYHWINTNFIYNGNNQIILATDGEFKDTNADMKAVYSLVRQQMRKGILLSVVGFGQDSDAVKLMRKLAYSGKGRYINIQDEGDAEGVLIEEIKANSKKF